MRTLRHRTALVTCCLILAGPLAACGSSSGSGGHTDTSTAPASRSAAGSTQETGSSLSGKTIADVGNVANAFMTCMRKDMLPAVQGAGAKTFTGYGMFTATGVQQVVEDAITRRPNAALYISESASLDDYSVKKLQGAGIPTLLAFGRASANAKPKANLAFDYAVNAKQVADNIARLLPGVTKVGNIDGQPGIPDTDLQDAALKPALAAKGISIVATLHSQYSTQGGATATQDILQAHPEIQALIVQADDATSAAVRTVAASGKKVPIISLINDTQSVVNLVKSGQLTFALVGQTSRWATQIRDALAAISQGKTVSPGTLGFTVVDKSNANTFKTC